MKIWVITWYNLVWHKVTTVKHPAEIDLSSNSLPGSMINHSSTADVVYMFIMPTLVWHKGKIKIELTSNGLPELLVYCSFLLINSLRFFKDSLRHYYMRLICRKQTKHLQIENVLNIKLMRINRTSLCLDWKETHRLWAEKENGVILTQIRHNHILFITSSI